MFTKVSAVFVLLPCSRRKPLPSGPDTTKYQVMSDASNPVDKIEDFWNARYLSAGEAMWRILGFHITHKDPAVTALPIHLPNSRTRTQYARSDGSESHLSLLDRYFLRPDAFFPDGSSNRHFSTLTYQEYYTTFRLTTFDPRREGLAAYYMEQANDVHSPRMHVVKRDMSCTHLTRIHHVRPSDGDVFYLRCILQKEPASSFVHARTVNGTIHRTFQDAAQAKGLFSDVSESTLTLTEAVECLYTPRQLRLLFADLLINDCLEFPTQTWNTFANAASFDFYLKHNHCHAIAHAYALQDMQSIVHEHGMTLHDYGLPLPDIPTEHETISEMDRWSSHQPFLLQRARATYHRLNLEQRHAYDIISNSLNAQQPLSLFIEGKAGTGKTTVITTLCDALRASNLIILPTATSAFAAQLYSGGRTTHSTFKVCVPSLPAPLIPYHSKQVSVTDNNELITSSIHPNDSRAQLLRDTSVITWDEAPMSNKAVLSCVEETCRSVMKNQQPFGGKIIILLGDFRQTCPVIRGGSKADVLNASIKSSPLWPSFQKMQLTQLIRNADDPEFAAVIDAIGDGQSTVADLRIFPRTTHSEDLLSFVFPDTVLTNPFLCLSRSILAPTNAQISDYNRRLLARLPGADRTYLAADFIKESEDQSTVPPAALLDYLSLHPPPSLPPPTLTLKTGAMCRMLRNFSVDRGLVKNARVVVTHLGAHLIAVQKLLEDGLTTDDILLPRITFTATLPSGHTLLRKQFPLAVAYATTFNSCQGLTLDRLGADLTRPVFSHGQLYTALSRVRRREHALLLLPTDDPYTTNVTYKELLM